ncbi:MAG: HD domain-containing phosphohydrolase [Planctomycetota bacterium]
MIRVRTDKVPAGSLLACPIYHPQRRNTVLLTRDSKLETSALERLIEFGVRDVWIQNNKLQEIEECFSIKLQAARENLAHELATSYESLVRMESPEYEPGPVKRACEEMIETVTEYSAAGLMIQEIDTQKPSLARHSADVAYLTLLMGMKLDFYLIRERPKLPPSAARDLNPLVLAGALHDLGMLAVPPDVRRRFQITGDEEDTKWRVHTGLGFALLKGRVEPATAAAVLNHHQAFDGSGFPPRRGGHGETIPISGHNIHVFARIIACAERFERLRYADETQPPIPMVEVLSKMQQEPIASKVDPLILNAMLAIVPPFAPGTVVTLNDEIECVVVTWRPLDPCRPVVATMESLLNTESAELDRIDLFDDDALQITHHEGTDIREHLFGPPVNPEGQMVLIENDEAEAA